METRPLVMVIVACLFACFGRSWLAAALNSLARTAISQRLSEKAIAWVRWSEFVAEPTAESEFLLARANHKLAREGPVRTAV